MLPSHLPCPGRQQVAVTYGGPRHTIIMLISSSIFPICQLYVPSATTIYEQGKCYTFWLANHANEMHKMCAIYIMQASCPRHATVPRCLHSLRPQQQPSAEVTCATICLGTRWQKYEAQNMSQLTQATGRPQKTLHELHELPASETGTPFPPPVSHTVLVLGTLSTPRPCIMGTLNCALI